MLSKAVFLDFASIHPDDLDVSCLEQMIPQWRWRDNTAARELQAAIADAEIVVVNKVVLDETALQQTSDLKLICAAATGVNNIDVAAASRLGITVCNARGYATASVVQHVFALLLSLTTRLEQYHHDVKNGVWSNSQFFSLLDHPIRELAGLTLGIVGYGELGSAVAKVAQAFGMRVLIAKRDEQDEREGRVALHEMLPQVDVLSLHCPLTGQTRGLIGKAELASMKSDAILINTARGGLVDEHALLQALASGQLAGAGLDVLEQEPPPADHALLNCDLDNLVLTPHTAWASREARQRVLQEVADNIRAYQSGQQRNVVSPG